MNKIKKLDFFIYKELWLNSCSKKVDKRRRKREQKLMVFKVEVKSHLCKEGEKKGGKNEFD